MTLFEAYRLTQYSVTLPSGAPTPVHVGRPAPHLDCALAAAGATSWAFVTAHNPGPRRLSRPINRRRHRALARAAYRRGLKSWPAVGLGHSGGPTERGCVLLGATADQATSLGQTFGQLAVLHGEIGHPVRPLLCS